MIYHYLISMILNEKWGGILGLGFRVWELGLFIGGWDLYDIG